MKLNKKIQKAIRDLEKQTVKFSEAVKLVSGAMKISSETFLEYAKTMKEFNERNDKYIIERNKKEKKQCQKKTSPEQ